MKKEEDNSRGMYVPTIGDEITLASPWKFGLYYEYRNEAMISYIYQGVKFAWHNMVLPDGQKPEYGKRLCDVELPKGSVLKVDRIYIRKGGARMKEFDSITFILQSVPNKEIAIPKESSYYAKDELGHFYTKKKTFFRKKPRFGTKLRDVNQIRFLMGREKVDTEEPFSGRLIRLGEGWEE